MSLTDKYFEALHNCQERLGYHAPDPDNMDQTFESNIQKSLPEGLSMHIVKTELAIKSFNNLLKRSERWVKL